MESVQVELQSDSRAIRSDLILYTPTWGPQGINQRKPKRVAFPLGQTVDGDNDTGDIVILVTLCC